MFMDFIQHLVSQEQKTQIKNYRQKIKPEQIKTHTSTDNNTCGTIKTFYLEIINL